MRRLQRVALPQRVIGALAAYQRDADRAVARERRKRRPEVRGTVEAEWRRRRGTRALAAVGVALCAMASGNERCMYCEDSRGSDIEHFRPKARHPESTFDWPNLLRVCADCNRQKNESFHEGLIDPTVDDPLDHLVLSFETGRWVERDVRGATTLAVIARLSRDGSLQKGRMLAWEKLKGWLPRYAEHRLAGRDADADLIRRVLVHEPFSGIFAAVLRAASEPHAVEVLGEALVGVIARHPEMGTWLQDADTARLAEASATLDAHARAIRLPKRGPRHLAARRPTRPRRPS